MKLKKSGLLAAFFIGIFKKLYRKIFICKFFIFNCFIYIVSQGIIMSGNIRNLNTTQYIPQYNYVPSNGATINLPNIPDRAQIKENVSANVSENPTVKASNGMSDPKVMLGALCFWPALMNIVRPINKAISGEYSTSLLGRIGNFGDKIFDKLHLGKIFNPEKTSKVSNFLNNNRLTKYFTKGYAAKPSISLVRSIGTQSELASDAVSVLREIAENNPSIRLQDFFKPEMLRDLGIVQAERGAAEAAKTAARSINIADFSDDLAVGIHKMAEHCKANGINESFTTGKFLKRHISLTELRNKLISIAPNQAKKTFEEAGISEIRTMMARTPLGKGMAKGSLRTLEGLTNGMAGGPIGTVFQAFCFAQAFKEAHEAPKGEKFSTFMHVVVNDLGSYLLMTSSKDLVYMAAGNKYRGMTKEGIGAFREFLTNVNASNLSGQALKIAKAQRKLFLKGVSPDAVKAFGEAVTKNPSTLKSAMKDAMKGAPKLKFWERPLKAIGRVLGMGLDSVKGGPLKKFPKLKGVAGGALRFGLVMMVVAPILLKPITKVCHMIFGTPKTYLAKEKGDKGKKNIQEQPQREPVNALDMIEDYKRQNGLTTTNIVNDFLASNPDANSSAAAMSPLSKSTPIKRYIPSSEPTQFNEEIDKKALEQLLKHGEMIEKRAMGYLK